MWIDLQIFNTELIYRDLPQNVPSLVIIKMS